MSSIVFAEALSGAVARSEALRSAEERRASCVTTPIGEVDVAWAKGLSKRVSASRAELHRLQLDLRAAPQGADLEDVVLARDVARHAHINLLAAALAEHDARCIQPRVDALSQEAKSLQGDLLAAPPQAVLVGSTLTKRLRLTKLCGPEEEAPKLLFEMSEWEKETAHMRAELEDLRPHGGGQAPSVEELHRRSKAWKLAKQQLGKAKLEQENASYEDEPAPDAKDKVRDARHAVQKAERELRLERVRLATLAAAHFPELFAREPLLRLGVGADGGVLQDVLVERDLDDYTGPDGGSAKSHKLHANNARHRVYRAVFDGDPCVLKEYELGDAKQWDKLHKEVRLLCRLRHAHIAALQAVFQHKGDSPVAYLQLAFYEGGDLSQWLEKQAPDLHRRKTVLQQLAQALQHMHAHGAAHGDIKLENVLISAQGTAHLADFELSREEQPHGSTTRFGVTTVGFTPQYVAPEMRSGAAPKPSAAADMYAFGVCVLLTCCPEGSYSFSPSGELQQWSREKAAEVDVHLPALLDSLLLQAVSAEEALACRLSATQVLLHPFLDTTAEREEASRASKEAQQLLQAAQSEEEAVRRKLHAEQQLAQRRLQWEAAEKWKQLAQTEEDMREKIDALRRDVQKREADIKGSERELNRKRREVQQREQAVKHAAGQLKEKEHDVAAKRRELTDEEKRVQAQVDKLQAEAAKKRKDLEAEQKRLQTEQRKLANLQAEKRAQPSYWEKRLASKSADGFAVLPLDKSKHGAVWRALEGFLATDPQHLGHGRDHQHPGHYDRLRLACAWRLEHPALWEKYAAGQQQVLRDMKLLGRRACSSTPGLPTKTARAASGLPALLLSEVNETVLLHGTRPQVLLSILSTGPNERFSGSNAGTAFGDGTYFAEDAGKNDQYVALDAHHDSSSELHKRLYAHVRHPGNVFYLLACRVSLGHHVRTQQLGRTASSMDDGTKIFPVSFRELAAVPGVSPPVHHHSLLAEMGGAIGRYREFIVFHSEYIYPEYLLAYQRFSGQRGPVG